MSKFDLISNFVISALFVLFVLAISISYYNGHSIDKELQQEQNESDVDRKWIELQDSVDRRWVELEKESDSHFADNNNKEKHI